MAAVQTAANARLAASLTRETNANTALNEANGQLTKSRAAVEARYKLAMDAIKTFHTGVSEDFLLKEEKFKELRNRLLKSASDFYGKLGALLGKETDIASRRALAQSNFELADLTGKVGRNEDALAAHRAVLAAREALAAEPGAGVVAKVDVGRSLIAVAGLLEATGKTDEALATYRRSESLLAGPAGADPSARAALAACRSQMGWLLNDHGQVRRRPGGLPAGAGRPGGAGRRSRSLQRGPPRPGGHGPPDRHPAVRDGQAAEAEAELPPGAGDLTRSWPTTTPPSPNSAAAWRGATSTSAHCWMDGQASGGGGRVSQGAGDLPEAGRRQPRRHRFPQRPGVEPRQPRLVAVAQGKLAEAEAELRNALALYAEARRRQPRRHRLPQQPGAKPLQPRPRVVEPGQASRGGGRVPQGAGDPAEAGRRQPRRHRFRIGLARSHYFLGILLSNTGKPAEAEAEFRKSMALLQKLADDDPAVTDFRDDLAYSHNDLGNVLSKTGKPAEAEAEYRKALAIRQKLVDDNPADTGSAAAWRIATSTSATCCRRRASQRRRRPSTARRWRSGRSWSTTTPPSPASAAAWRTATSTSASCCRTRASQRRRRPSSARRWRSGRSWSTTTPLSSISAAACPSAT